MDQPMVNIHEAKTHFSKIINNVRRGHEIVIAMAGEPVARIVPISEKPQIRFGVLKGKFEIPEDFDAPLPDDILEAFGE